MLKKSLSQHLLKEKNILKKMLSRTDITKEDTVIEIGAGTGELTNLLKEVAGQIYAVEIDRTFSPYLDEIAKNSNVKIIYGDFLKLDIAAFAAQRNVKIIGNIPYKITGPILFKIFNNLNHVESAYLTLQREVAERITAKPKSKSFGALSVISQVLANTKIEFLLPPELFVPPPKVDSAFVSFIFKESSRRIPPDFFTFVKNCFRQKRKLLFNSLKHSYSLYAIQSLFERAGLEKSVRAEEIPPEKFLDMFELIREME